MAYLRLLGLHIYTNGFHGVTSNPNDISSTHIAYIRTASLFLYGEADTQIIIIIGRPICYFLNCAMYGLHFCLHAWPYFSCFWQLCWCAIIGGYIMPKRRNAGTDGYRGTMGRSIPALFQYLTPAVIVRVNEINFTTCQPVKTIFGGEMTEGKSTYLIATLWSCNLMIYRSFIKLLDNVPSKHIADITVIIYPTLRQND
jgi:hypothetical protein